MDEVGEVSHEKHLSYLIEMPRLAASTENPRLSTRTQMFDARWECDRGSYLR